VGLVQPAVEWVQAGVVTQGLLQAQQARWVLLWAHSAPLAARG
jgi:hypothetical protein